MDIRRAGPDYFSGSPSRSMERDDRGIHNKPEARYSPKELIRTRQLRSYRLEQAFHSLRVGGGTKRGRRKDESTAKSSHVSRKVYFGRSQSCFRGDIHSDLAGVDDVIATVLIWGVF